MSEQRIDDAADAATTADSDDGNGQGLSPAAAHPITAGSGDLLNLQNERRPADESPQGNTEGERSVRTAELNRRQ